MLFQKQWVHSNDFNMPFGKGLRRLFENKVQYIIVYRLQTCKLINYALQMNYDGTTREMTL